MVGRPSKIPPAKARNETRMLLVMMNEEAKGRCSAGSQSRPAWCRSASPFISSVQPGRPMSTSTASGFRIAANRPMRAPAMARRKAAAMKAKLRRKHWGKSRVKKAATEAAPPRSAV